jgi:hypothetical protein
LSELQERNDRLEAQNRSIRARIDAKYEAHFGGPVSPEFIEHVTALQKAWLKDGEAGLRRYKAPRGAV